MATNFVTKIDINAQRDYDYLSHRVFEVGKSEEDISDSKGLTDVAMIAKF